MISVGIWFATDETADAPPGVELRPTKRLRGFVAFDGLAFPAMVAHCVRRQPVIHLMYFGPVIRRRGEVLSSLLLFYHNYGLKSASSLTTLFTTRATDCLRYGRTRGHILGNYGFRSLCFS